MGRGNPNLVPDQSQLCCSCYHDDHWKLLHLGSVHSEPSDAEHASELPYAYPDLVVMDGQRVYLASKKHDFD